MSTALSLEKRANITNISVFKTQVIKNMIHRAVKSVAPLARGRTFVTRSKPVQGGAHPVSFFLYTRLGNPFFY